MKSDHVPATEKQAEEQSEACSIDNPTADYDQQPNKCIERDPHPCEAHDSSGQESNMHQSASELPGGSGYQDSRENAREDATAPFGPRCPLFTLTMSYSINSSILDNTRAANAMPETPTGQQNDNEHRFPSLSKPRGM